MTLAGCELSEVVVPNGDPIVVVQAVMRPDLAVQSVFVERSLVGDEELEDDEDAIAIINATVTVTNLTRSTLRCSGPIAFTLVDSDRGRYESPIGGCPLLEVGDNMELNVETPGGEKVFGTMKVPEMRSIMVTQTGIRLPTGVERIELNRELDTLLFDVVAGSGRGLFVESQSLTGLIGIDRRLSFFVDTVSVQLVGDLISDFDDDGAQLFRAGRFANVSIGLMDENFFRFNQTRNDPFTGRGFDNRLEGGLGVFGGVDARFFSVRAVANIDDPREGIYRLRGDFGMGQVDITWELYLVENTPQAEFSAFVSGIWPGLSGPLNTSLDGTFNLDILEAVFDLSIATPNVFIFRGDNALAQSFEIQVSDGNNAILGTLQVTR